MVKIATKKILRISMAFALLLLIGGGVFAQSRTVSGIVTDKDQGETLIGVSIVPVGTEGLGTVTDFDGKYSINVPESVT